MMTAHQPLVGPFRVSESAWNAMVGLWNGHVVMPDESVVQELGHLGLAHRFDLRRFHSRRIVLTYQGVMYRPNSVIRTN